MHTYEVKVNADHLLLVLAGRRREFVQFIRRRADPSTDAEDLVQQALLKASRKLGQVQDPDHVVAWFYTVLRRVLADERARASLRQLKMRQFADALNPSPPDPMEACGCSLNLVERMPTEYAEILRRVDIGGEDLATASQSLGITVNNATVRLHRARKALRAKLATVCGTTSARECLSCDCP